MAEAGYGSLRRALAAQGVRPFLAFGFVNALPTAVTSTLFLFSAADVLGAEAYAGPLLLLFFAAAAAGARMGTPGRALRPPPHPRMCDVALDPGLRRAWLLGPGDVAPFYAVAIASGAALGADMTLAPAMLAARMRTTAGVLRALNLPAEIRPGASPPASPSRPSRWAGSTQPHP